jgi:hypothetical protein
MLARILLPITALLLLRAMWPAPVAEPLAVDRDLATLVPDDALVFVEAPGLSALAASGLDAPLARAILATDLSKALRQNTGKSAAELLDEADAKLGFELLPTIASLGERGVALALSIRRPKPSTLVLARGADAESQRATVEKLLAIAADKAGHPDAFDEPSADILGAATWRVGGELVVAVRDSLLVLGNDEGFVRDALELAAKVDARGLAGDADFAAAAAERSPAHFAWAWTDLAGIERIQNEAEKGEGIAKLRAMVAEPAAQALLGPCASAMGTAAALTLAIDVEREDVGLALRAHGVDAQATEALMPGQRDGAPPALAPTPRDVASAALYRDYAAFFQRRAHLFATDKLPALAKATSDLAPIVGGLDIGSDVLPGVSPWLRVVAREIEFDAAERPEIPLPAAALLAEVDDVERTGALLVSAFQTAIGLVNVNRGQQAKSPMVMTLELVGGVPMTSARFLAPREGEGVDAIHNLAPACALAGRTFVVGTHAKLVAEIVRELAAGETRAEPSADRLWIRGPALARVVEANFDALAAKAVLEEGKTREKAEADLRGLAALLELAERADMAVERAGEREIALSLALDLTAALD